MDKKNNESNKDNNMSNDKKVVSIKEKKKVEGVKFEEKKKPNRWGTEKLLLSVLCRNEDMSPLGHVPFVMDYVTFRDTSGGRMILEYHPRTKTYTIEDRETLRSDLFSRVTKWESDYPCQAAKFSKGYDMCKQAVDNWIGLKNEYDNKRLLKEMPRDIAFKTENVDCMHRLDYDPQETDDMRRDAPIFVSMMGRLTNADALCAKIGALFDMDADRKQTIWLYGPSNGGKSQIQKLIGDVVGGHQAGSISFQQEALKGRFSKAKLVGKRVWNVNEATPEVFRMSDYKTLTGDSNHTIEQKYKDSYSVDLKGHMFLTSNHPPEIPNDDALKSRIIPCYAEPVPQEERMPSDVLTRKIKEEIPYIVGYCLKVYAKTQGRDIGFDDSALLEEVENDEMGIYSLFGQSYVFDESVGKDTAKVTTQQICEAMGITKNRNHSGEFKDLMKWLRSKGCEKVQKRVGKAKPYFITGIRTMTAIEKQQVFDNPYRT